MPDTRCMTVAASTQMNSMTTPMITSATAETLSRPPTRHCTGARAMRPRPAREKPALPVIQRAVSRRLANSNKRASSNAIADGPMLVRISAHTPDTTVMTPDNDRAATASLAGAGR